MTSFPEKVHTLPVPFCRRNGSGHPYLKPQRHLLQEDLIEDCLRDHGVLTQTMPPNVALLFRGAFLGSMGREWGVLKELAAEFLTRSRSLCL